ncbi:MAG: hypothetical protein HC809_08035 [Gammaproteobacteria bacterium]|nr:hypothetical protein [Gammaproteobacteria bacterium]
MLVAVLLVLLVPTWTGQVDDLAQTRTRIAFENALVTFALARTLNGVISVAQGTELAFQPAGVGVVVTAGEILDPLNDLIEQFSWLTLLATTSLGAQILLSQMFATPFANGVVTVAVAGAALAWLFAPPAGRLRRHALQIALALTIIRFAVAFAALTTSWVTATFLDEREAESVAYLSDTSTTIEATADAPTSPRGPLDSLSDLLDDAREAMALRERIDSLQARAEAATEHIINLIVVYMVETLLLPIAMLAAAWAALKYAIRRVGNEPL